jgi:hypothetical protein
VELVGSEHAILSVWILLPRHHGTALDVPMAIKGLRSFKVTSDVFKDESCCSGFFYGAVIAVTPHL